MMDEHRRHGPVEVLFYGLLIATFMLAALIFVGSLAGCTVSGGLGPTITMTGDKGPLDYVAANKSDGSVDVSIEAGEDVGYHLELWRNKSAPNISSEVHDTEGKR